MGQPADCGNPAVYSSPQTNCPARFPPYWAEFLVSSLALTSAEVGRTCPERCPGMLLQCLDFPQSLRLDGKVYRRFFRSILMIMALTGYLPSDGCGCPPTIPRDFGGAQAPRSRRPTPRRHPCIDCLDLASTIVPLSLTPTVSNGSPSSCDTQRDALTLHVDGYHECFDLITLLIGAQPSPGRLQERSTDAPAVDTARRPMNTPKSVIDFI
jgi:hypothetical protein